MGELTLELAKQLTQELAKQLTQEAESTEFTVDFDELWQWCGYSRKDNAKRMLKSRFFESMDFVETFLTLEEHDNHAGSSLHKKSSATKPMKIWTTPDCAKKFGMLAQTKEGDRVRDYFVEAEKELRAIQANLTPAELLLQQAQRLVDQERKQRELEKEVARQSKQLEETTNIANINKVGLEKVYNELASLKEFAVAQPEGLDQDKADLINQAFQQLGAVLEQAGIEVKPKCYQKPWKELGLTMRNSSINYDLNARYANAKKAYKTAHDKWVKNGKPRGQAPKKPSRISILLKDNKVTDAFKAAQQVITSNLAKLK